MKKTLTYAAMAIFLGIALMLLPAFILLPSGTSTMQELASSQPPEARVEDIQKRTEVVSTAPFLSNLIYAVFILFLGFFVALGISQLFKKKWVLKNHSNKRTIVYGLYVQM